MATFPIIESPGFTFNVATVHVNGFAAPADQQRPNARLLVAGFNAFDRAGRELHTDAATLAEQIDLAALIRWAGAVVAVHEAFPLTNETTPLDEAIHGLISALPRTP